MLGIGSLLLWYVVRPYDNKMTYLLSNLTARHECNLYHKIIRQSLQLRVHVHLKPYVLIVYYLFIHLTSYNE